MPNRLFFCDECEVDLNETYGTKGRRYKVRGLINLFQRYKFTVEENTPVEEEVALDPELLGKVFENLLAAYNPETGVTARKLTGSFYTPREIVDYMVDESLIVYLVGKLDTAPDPSGLDLEDRLRHLLAYTLEPPNFTEAETVRLVAAIDDLKVLDPACGSGAFPMGVLHKLVYLLRKLDPRNTHWRELQRRKALRDTEDAYRIGERSERQQRLLDIEDTFERNSSDYGRKLYLIENCIYGVDIQPIAVQIAKLRCFISLVVDQTPNEGRPNRGIRPLPNLETKFVAANTLIGVVKPLQGMLVNPAIEEKEAALREVRDAHFRARTPETKEKYRGQDRRLREEIAALLEQDGLPRATSEQLAGWNPYDHNAHAEFFDPEWMFGVREGFDIVIGNPPYMQLQRVSEVSKQLAGQNYRTYVKIGDVYCIFYEKSFFLTKPGGISILITSNSWLRTQYGQPLRGFLTDHANPLLLVDFADSQLFESAIVETSILMFQRAIWDHNMRATSVTATTGGSRPLSELIRQDCVVVTTLDQTSWTIGNAVAQKLKGKIERDARMLVELGMTINFGIKTGFNDGFIVSEATRETLIKRDPNSAKVMKPLLRGRDVRKYSHTFAGVYLINAHNGLPRRGIPPVSVPVEYPAVYDFMRQFETQLRARQDQGHHWTNLRNCAYLAELDKPKIIWGELSDEPKFSYDPDGFYAEATLFFMTGPNLKFLLAILNCKLMAWYFAQISTTSGMGTNRWKKYKLEKLPIKNASAKEQRSIIALVEDILIAKRANPAADVSAQEREIDQWVYRLYGLTAAEIAIVEAGDK